MKNEKEKNIYNFVLDVNLKQLELLVIQISIVNNTYVIKGFVPYITLSNIMIPLQIIIGSLTYEVEVFFTVSIQRCKNIKDFVQRVK